MKKDMLSLQGIEQHLQENNQNLDITVLPITSSTNTLVREHAEQGGKEGYVVIAKEQTAGRGRRGRSFFSPSGTGLYLSILLRPDHILVSQAVSFTTMAAVAMCEAIEEVCDKHADIKWVNDIFVDGRKVCGILTEVSLEVKSGVVDYAVLGAGVNVYAPKDGFPEDIADKAGALFETEQEELKNRLAAAFLNRFMECYKGQRQDNYVSEYQRRSLAVGREVTVISGGDEIPVFAYGVDEACRLLVVYENGDREALSSGEISIKIN